VKKINDSIVKQALQRTSYLLQRKRAAEEHAEKASRKKYGQ